MSLPTESQILAWFQGTSQQQFTLKRVIQHFKVVAAERPALRRLVRAMAARGNLVHLYGAHYALPQRFNTLAGVVQRHEDGYGFVVPDDEAEPDVYVPRRFMAGVMHGDRVLVRLQSGRQRGERRNGSIVQVLERTQQDIIGRIDMVGKACWVVPADARLCPPIAIAPRGRRQARSGMMVVVAVTSFTLAQEHPQGNIIEVLGEVDDPNLELEIILHQYGLPRSFPPDVAAEATAISSQIAPATLAGRRDLRALLTCTIDGETARDFDDAVSLELLPNGHYRLGVHIADVSHYVHPDSPLDREAQARGTSVYFPDRVIPMLPARLSQEVCCLQPDVDRLTLSIFIELTPAGDTAGYDIVDAVIRSRARLTYTRVAEYLDGNSRALDGWEPALGEVLQAMARLATVLRQRRLAAGSLDFDLPESDIVLDNEGKIDKILRAERNQAHLLIEDFMLLANRTVAMHLGRAQFPTLYRVHPPPTPEKIAHLRAFVQTLGYTLPEDTHLQPRDVQNLLAAVRGQTAEQLVNHMLLRSLQRARYTPQNSGHFGLAFSHYTHFTSPIRRYPDLLVHRLLRDMHAEPAQASLRRDFWTRHLPPLADHASNRERLADEATRAVIALKKAELMRDKVGETYTGVITGVTRFGLFVELEDLFVEGMVPIAWLPGTFSYDEQRLRLVGQYSGQTYQLGARLQVRVDKVNLPRRQIDFTLLGKG